MTSDIGSPEYQQKKTQNLTKNTQKISFQNPENQFLKYPENQLPKYPRKKKWTQKLASKTKKTSFQRKRPNEAWWSTMEHGLESRSETWSTSLRADQREGEGSSLLQRERETKKETEWKMNKLGQNWEWRVHVQRVF